MRHLSLLVGAPGLLVALARAAMLAAELSDVHPYWPRVDVNLAEAAALRDGGEVARLLEAGADPNERYTVRRGYLRNRPMTVTPIEAARAAGRPEIEALLLTAGARLPAAP